MPHDGGLGHPPHPVGRLGPGQRAEIDRRVAVRACGVADGVQIDTHVTQARTTRGERHAEPHDIVHCAAQAGQAEGDVHVGRCQDPSHVERVQQPAGAVGEGSVEAIQPVENRHVGAPRSKRSLSDSTSCAGGRQDHTPQGQSSTRAGSTALIPRTNR